MDRKHFGTELVEALSTVGFVKFTDHGISEEQIVEVFGWVSADGVILCGSHIPKLTEGAFANAFERRTSNFLDYPSRRKTKPHTPHSPTRIEVTAT